MSGVDISIEHQTAMNARMSPFLEIFVWPFFETPATDLTGIFRRNEQDRDVSGTLSLGTYHSYKCTPPSITNTFIQSSLGRCTIGKIRARFILLRFWAATHIRGFQVLKDNRLVAVHHHARLLVMEIVSLSSHLAMTGGNTLHRFFFSGCSLASCGQALVVPLPVSFLRAERNEGFLSYPQKRRLQSEASPCRSQRRDRCRVSVGEIAPRTPPPCTRIHPLF